MPRWLSERVAELVTELRSPHDDERRRANHHAWQSLDPRWRSAHQTLGRQQPGCSATHNILERCDFSCTACYLAPTANTTPPLPFEDVRDQLETIRRHQGRFANVQITAGEVTLMPVEDLCRIVRCANELDLSPMVMSHGETFRDDPSYLPTLMREGGLAKVAIHIDTTQRGRRGLKRSDREPDIHWLRDEFANIVREARHTTGLPLDAAQTLTITEGNLADVASVMRWSVNNVDAFRMLSLQPTAAVGRTRTDAIAGSEPMRVRLWENVGRGVGRPLNPQPMLFGHPRCNQVGLYFVVNYDDQTEVVEVTREGEREDEAFWSFLMQGSFAGFSPDGLSAARGIANLLGRMLEDPRLLTRILRYCAYRAGTERKWLRRFAAALLRGRKCSIHPFVTVVHHFMSAAELKTPEGRERLAACSFKLPVDGQMISMCEMNGTQLRRDLNQQTRRRLQVVA